MGNKLKRCFSMLVLLFFTANVMFSYNLHAEEKSLKSTFANLKSAMGEVVKPEVNKDLDDALGKAFDPVPEEIKKSNVPVAKLDTKETEKAIAYLATTPLEEPMLPLQDGLSVEYEQRGVALSLALWHGAKVSLTNLFRNVITQIHNEDEANNFRFVVNSSPVPSIEIEDVDFNLELRTQKELEIKRIPLDPNRPPPKVNVPARMGLEIIMSSGMLATLANVDEFAGQIYKALALKNPKLYGITTDPRFERNQQYLALLSEIVDASHDDVKKEVNEKKEMVKAELSAMDRLAAGGFNPWAVHHYEERIFSWIADVYLKKSSHAFGRWLVSNSVYKIDDWSRPFRIQLQEAYMYHLINSGRVLNKGLKNTEFSAALKFVRLRMKLFTTPFFSGATAQVGSVGLMAGATYSSFSFPEMAHWALSAINQTTEGFRSWLDKITIHQTISGKVGEYIADAKKISQQVLDSSFFSFDYSGVSDAAITVAKDFFISYEKGLIISGAVIGAAAFTYLVKTLAPVIHSAANHIEEERTKNILALNEQEMSRQDIDVEREEKPEPEQTEYREKVQVVMGQKISSPRLPRTEMLGKSLANFLMSFKNGTISLYEDSRAGLDSTKSSVSGSLQSGKTKIAQFISSTGSAIGDGYFVAVRKTKSAGSKSLNALAAVADAGAAASRSVGRASVSGTTRAWETMGRIARETPGAVERARAESAEARVRNAERIKEEAMAEADAAAEILISFGHGVLRTSKFGFKITKTSGRFIFITAPVAITKGSVAAVVGTSNWGVKQYKDLAESMAAARETRRRQKQFAKELAQKQKAADLQREQEKKERIAKGEIRRKEFFAAENLPLNEIFQFAEMAYDYSHGNKTADTVKNAEAWGFDEKWFAEKPKNYLLPALKKWLAEAKKIESITPDFRAMSTLLDKYYSDLPLGERLDKDFVKFGMDFYETVSKMNSNGLWSHLSYDSNSSTVKRGIFLEHMEWHYKKMMALQPQKVENRVKAFVNPKMGPDDPLLKVLGDDLYRGNEKFFVRFLVNSRDDEEFSSVLARVSNYLYKHRGNRTSQQRFGEAVASLSSLERAKIYVTAQRIRNSNEVVQGPLVRLGYVANQDTLDLISKSLEEVSELWITQSPSVKELARRIEYDSKRFDLTLEPFSLHLRNALMSHPEVISGREDLDILFSKNYFWPHHNSVGNTTALEKPLHELLKMKRQQFADSPAWKYDPIFAEKIHTIIKKRLENLNQFPTDFEGLETIWRLFSSRGVSTVTDQILAALLKMGTVEQISRLEEYAVKEGRVFDQGLRDEFAIRQVKRSPEYEKVMSLKDAPTGTNRSGAISELIAVAQTSMSDLGLRYVELMEEISVGIKSTYEEAKLIHEAKTNKLKALGQETAGSMNDSRTKMLRDILPHMKNWKPQDQFDFLLYLRGSIEATKFIESQFPTFGPERIRQIFQSLPTDAAMLVINLYLSETLLANTKRSFGQKKDLMGGYGKKLINFLVDQGSDEKVKNYSRLFLTALLNALEKVGNESFQKQVLSALIAMKPKQDNSIGETLKLILEQFPGVGPKIGQFTVATRLLSKSINDVLEKTQDQTLPPSRFTMYGDLEHIVGKDRMGAISIDRLEGGGSIKYTFSATDMATLNKLVFQVFREDVQNAAGLYIEVLNHAIDELIRTGGPEWAFLRVIVDGAMNAVKRERQFRRESTKTNVARLRLYSKFSDSDFTVMVPEQDVLNERLLMASLAKGVSFNKLSQEDKDAVGRKLLEMETSILFAEGRPVIWYDTDRHAGNYIIDVSTVNGKKHYKIWPIDFGQLTYIRTEQRDKIAEMFGIAGILDKMGSNESLVLKVAALFDIKGRDLDRLHKSLASLFPVQMKSSSASETGFIRPYFTLIAAINSSLDAKEKVVRHRDLQDGKLDFAYTDFVRAIIQLNQYEKQITLPPNVLTPRQILEKAAKDFGWKHMQTTELSRKQSLGLQYINTKNQIKSLVSGQEYKKIDMRMSREDFDKLTMADLGKPVAEKPAVSVENPAKASRGLRCLMLFPKRSH